MSDEKTSFATYVQDFAKTQHASGKHTYFVYSFPNAAEGREAEKELRASYTALGRELTQRELARGIPELQTTFKEGGKILLVRTNHRPSRAIENALKKLGRPADRVIL